MVPENTPLQLMHVSHYSGEDKVLTPFPQVTGVHVTTDTHTPEPEIYMTTDFHSQVPDIHMTTDTEISVDTFSSSPVAYPESVTTQVEVRGEFVSEPWVTTMVPPPSFFTTVLETVTEDVIPVATPRPNLGYEVPRYNVSIGE